MTLTLQIIFWTAILCILFSYVLYPAILTIISPLFSDKSLVYNENEKLPNVFIIMSVFNEEKVIGAKLVSLFNTNYPLDKLNVIIGSDASSDKTEEIVKNFQKKNQILI